MKPGQVHRREAHWWGPARRRSARSPGARPAAGAQRSAGPTRRSCCCPRRAPRRPTPRRAPSMRGTAGADSPACTRKWRAPVCFWAQGVVSHCFISQGLQPSQSRLSACQEWCKRSGPDRASLHCRCMQASVQALWQSQGGLVSGLLNPWSQAAAQGEDQRQDMQASAAGRRDVQVAQQAGHHADDSLLKWASRGDSALASDEPLSD